MSHPERMFGSHGVSGRSGRPRPSTGEKAGRSSTIATWSTTAPASGCGCSSTARAARSAPLAPMPAASRSTLPGRRALASIRSSRAVEQLAAFARWLERHAVAQAPARAGTAGSRQRPQVVTVTRGPFCRHHRRDSRSRPSSSSASAASHGLGRSRHRRRRSVVREQLRFMPAALGPRRAHRPTGGRAPRGAPSPRRACAGDADARAGRRPRRRLREHPGPLRRRGAVRHRAFGWRSSAACASSDLHLVPSAAHLGCQVAGPHLHVRAPRGQRERCARPSRSSPASCR